MSGAVSIGAPVHDQSVGLGVVDELTIGSSDIDATTDAGTSGATARGGAVSLGPMRSFRVTSGSGNFVYVDAVTGATRTLTNLQTGDEQAPIAVKTIKGTSNGSAALTLRVRW